MTDILPVSAGGYARSHRSIPAWSSIRVKGVASTHIATIVAELPILHRSNHVVVGITRLIHRRAELIVSKRFEVLVLVPEKSLCVGGGNRCLADDRRHVVFAVALKRDVLEQDEFV